MDFGSESGNLDVRDRLILDYRAADLDETDRALCDHAVRLTLAPALGGPGAGAGAGRIGVEALRGLGLADEAILVATQVIGYFNYVNRVAEGLHVDPEPWMTRERSAWLEDKGRDYASTVGLA